MDSTLRRLQVISHQLETSPTIGSHDDDVKELDNFFSQEDANFKCFGCSKTNERGLKLKYFANKRGEVFAWINATDDLTSFPGVVHGGILSLILDDCAFWTLYNKLSKLALTSKIEVTFLKVAKTGSPLEVRGHVEKVDGKRVTVKVIIRDNDGEICASASVIYYLAPEEQIRKVIGGSMDLYRKHLVV